MIYISEQQSAQLISHEMAFDAVTNALISASGNGKVFPVAFASASEAANVFGFKSASSDSLTGGKIGSYWGTLEDGDIGRHGTFIFLLNQDTGRLQAIVEASEVNAYRTAAADAVAASVLARPNTKHLTVFGTGHQAKYECLALCRIRPIEKILVVGRSDERIKRFIDELTIPAKGVSVEADDARHACEHADIIVTATSSGNPLFDADWVRPGTHIASMGADSVGKQEIPVELLKKADLYCDLDTQSVSIGEFQHIAELIDSGDKKLTMIGDVLSNQANGRVSEDQITVFDSSGIALQDIFIAQSLLNRMETNNDPNQEVSE
jgi:ornithine cyclodeaminase